MIRDDSSYPAAIALVSVHPAIALNDALLLKLRGTRQKNADHTAAATETEKACTERRIDTKGIKHLRLLLSKKSEVSYGERATSFETASALAVSSERFQEWVYSALRRLEKAR